MNSFTKFLQLTFNILTTKLLFHFKLDPTNLLILTGIILQNCIKGWKMKKCILKTALVIGLLQLQATLVFAQASPALMQAHQNFLKKDYQGLLTSLNLALKERNISQAAKENINALLTKSFEINKGNLKTDQQLPEGLLELALVTRRGQKKNSFDEIVEIKGSVKSPGLIKNIQLIKYPDLQILNKESSQNEFKENKSGFYLKTKLTTALEDGLYRVLIVMQNDQTLDMWLPLIDLSVSETPKILSPLDEETTLSHNPEIHWQLFNPLKPTAYKTRITVEAALSNPPEYAWDVKWGINLNDITKNSSVVGREIEQYGNTSLAGGRYLIVVNQRADRKYGPIRVSTQSSQRVSLFVR
jgi:hypothetical protein